MNPIRVLNVFKLFVSYQRTIKVATVGDNYEAGLNALCCHSFSLLLYFVCANNTGSGETVRTHRKSRHIFDKYHFISAGFLLLSVIQALFPAFNCCLCV